jgi:hypothetical protein
MSLLSVVQTFCKRSGLPVPSTVVTARDAQTIQVLALLHEVTEDLCDRWSWQALLREVTFTTVEGEDQGLITDIAPDFLRVLHDTIFDRTTGSPLFGPLAAADWQARKAGAVTSPWGKYRIRGGHLLLSPKGVAGHTCGFEYMTARCIVGADGTPRSLFAADDDTFILPESLLLAGLRWKWKSEKGLDYAEDFRRFEDLATNAAGRDGAKPQLSFSDAYDGICLSDDGSRGRIGTILGGMAAPATPLAVGIASTDFSVSGSPVIASGTITLDLKTTTVVPGTYTNPTLTVDAKGRVIAAANGSAGGGGGSGPESDPVFGVTPASGITTTDIAHWNTAYSWGNHASAGYRTAAQTLNLSGNTLSISSGNSVTLPASGPGGITSEVDPVFSAAPAAGITSGNIANWNTAFGWGNHAGLYSLVGHTHPGYLTSESDPVFAASAAAGVTSGLITSWNTAAAKRVTGLAFSGTTTKTLTLTLNDASTITGTFVDADTNTDAQTLSIVGTTLSISGGNSVTLPSGSGGTVIPQPPGGRLTLASGVPAPVVDVVSAGTLYYTPYLSAFVWLYNGTVWVAYPFTERSIAVTITSGKARDVFLQDVSGTPTLSFSADWTNDTTRADALGTQDGVTVLGSDHTKLWLGTIYGSGTNTTEDSKFNRYVSNAYNTVLRKMATGVVSDSHSYTTGAWREWHGGTNSVRFNFVTARAQDFYYGLFGEMTGITGGGSAYISANLDTTGGNGGFFPGTAGSLQIGIGAGAICPTTAAPGKHIIYPLQFGTTGANFVDYSMTAGIQG